MVINNQLLEDLLEQASCNVRKRVCFDLRNGVTDTSQRMLNAILPGSVVDIHRHSNTSETVLLIQGELTEIFYNGNGKEIARYNLSLETGNVGLQIPAGQWHNLICHKPSVILEIKDGAYKPLSSDDLLYVKNNVEF